MCGRLASYGERRGWEWIAAKVGDAWPSWLSNDGHKTDTVAAVTYSTVVLRDSVRIILLAAALNGLDTQCADIQSAFLTAPNLEKLYLKAGPEFGDLEGRYFIVKRALYGLATSGKDWYEAPH